MEEASFAYDSTYNEHGADQLEFKLRSRAKLLANKALGRQPDNIDALNLLGRLALDEGDLPSAATWLDQGLAIEPDSISLCYSKAHVCLALQDYAAAELLFSKVEEDAPGATQAKHLWPLLEPNVARLWRRLRTTEN